MRIRIQLITAMRIRIQLITLVRSHANPDPQHWFSPKFKNLYLISNIYKTRTEQILHQ
jgi:hypothetical protein